MLDFHAKDDSERTLLTPGAKRDFYARLANAGFFVASSRAHGNSWGNPAAERDYRRLASYMRRTYRTGKVLLLGASMGGVPSLNAARRGTIPRTVGWVGVAPVTDLAAFERTRLFGPSIRQAWGRTPPASADPSRASRYRVPLLMLYSERDQLVPASVHAEPFVERFGVQPVRLGGRHLAPPVYDAGAVARFFRRLLR